VHTKKAQAFRHQNVQTLWLDWIHVWHESIPGEGQCTAQHVTVTHATVTELTRKLGHSHKLYMDNFFSSLNYLMIWWRNIYCCGTVRPNKTGMPQHLKPKTTKLKTEDIRVRTRAHLTAISWRDKRDVCMLTNIHNAPAEGNFCNERGKAINPQIVMDYNHHMGYVNKGDRMTNSYSTSQHIFKWTKNSSFIC